MSKCETIQWIHNEKCMNFYTKNDCRKLKKRDRINQMISKRAFVWSKRFSFPFFFFCFFKYTFVECVEMRAAFTRLRIIQIGRKRNEKRQWPKHIHTNGTALKHKAIPFYFAGRKWNLKRFTFTLSGSFLFLYFFLCSSQIFMSFYISAHEFGQPFVTLNA